MMKMTKVFCRLLTALLIIGNIILTTTAYAKIETYEGRGLVAVDIDETLSHAKDQAKLNAMRHIAEEVYAKLQNETESENGKLTRDEIVIMAESLIKVMNVKYDISSSKDNEFIVTATVTAEVDTDDVEKLLEDNK